MCIYIYTIDRWHNYDKLFDVYGSLRQNMIIIWQLGINYLICRGVPFSDTPTPKYSGKIRRKIYAMSDFWKVTQMLFSTNETSLWFPINFTALGILRGILTKVLVRLWHECASWWEPSKGANHEMQCMQPEWHCISQHLSSICSLNRINMN